MEGQSYFDHWRELAAEAWGEPQSVAYGIEEGLEALCEYANEGGTGFEAIEALEASVEFFRAASLEIQGEGE
jgi:hypothetical protein